MKTKNKSLMEIHLALFLFGNNGSNSSNPLEYFFKSIQVSTVAIGLLTFSTFPVFVTFPTYKQVRS